MHVHERLGKDIYIRLATDRGNLRLDIPSIPIPFNQHWRPALPRIQTLAVCRPADSRLKRLVEKFSHWVDLPEAAITRLQGTCFKQGR